MLHACTTSGHRLKERNLGTVKLRTAWVATLATALTIGGAVSPLAYAAPIASTDIPVVRDARLIDDLGRPSPEVLRQARAFAQQPFVPAELRDPILAAVEFYEGGHTPEGAPLLNPEETPAFKQFYWPTISGSCIGGSHASVGTAIAVPGPAALPLPGVPEGQSAFVFTALGTPGLADEQKHAMNVHWINIDTLKTGTTRLQDGGLNPDGPATLTATAETGKGTVIALLEGTVDTSETACTYAPTAAMFSVK